MTQAPFKGRPLPKPKSFGRFRAEAIIGRGGMGTVYLATDPIIRRQVAIKEVSMLSAGNPRELAELKARFELEFRSAGKLSHPNLVTIYDVGESDSAYFIAMEYIEGTSLARLLKSEAELNFSEVVELGAQIASGLDYAHAHGIVHRDVKPGNILITADRKVKLTDFGLVKLVSTDLTQTGMVLGTPAFMSPEQVLDRPLDGRSDQFSLAVILYLLLTGDQPFPGDHPSSILYKIVHDPAPSPRSNNSQLPRRVDKVLLKALSKQPENRFESCSELASALRLAFGGTNAGTTLSRAAQETVAAVTEPISREDRGGAEDEDGDDTVSATQILGSHGSGEEATLGIDSGELEIRGADEPQAVVERARAAHRSGRRFSWIGGLAAVLLLAGAALLSQADWRHTLLSNLGLATSPSPSAQAPEAGDSLTPDSQERSAEAETAPSIWVVSATEGLAIWMNGHDTGLRTPAQVPLEGENGDTVSLELRQGEDVTASREVVLGPALPEAWNAAPPAAFSEAFQITSQPEGASILLGGEPTGDITPAELELDVDTDYQLALRLDGYEPAGMSVRVTDLGEARRAEGRLHFPLTAKVPPTSLTIEADYPVAVRVGRRRQKPARRHQLSLPPGTYEIELVADEVFLKRNYSMTLGSGQRHELAAPPAIEVQIAANPGNCRVSIDGRFADVTPINSLRLAAGPHELLFEWPALQKTQSRAIDVATNGQRIFVTAD